MYALFIPTNVKRDLKKLDKPVISRVIQLFEMISENPFIGTRLSGDLDRLFKADFSHHGVSYRIVYVIVEENIQVKVVQVGTRENFYEELRRRL